MTLHQVFKLHTGYAFETFAHLLVIAIYQIWHRHHDVTREEYAILNNQHPDPIRAMSGKMNQPQSSFSYANPYAPARENHIRKLDIDLT